MEKAVVVHKFSIAFAIVLLSACAQQNKNESTTKDVKTADGKEILDVGNNKIVANCSDELSIIGRVRDPISGTITTSMMKEKLTLRYGCVASDENALESKNFCVYEQTAERPDEKSAEKYFWALSDTGHRSRSYFEYYNHWRLLADDSNKLEIMTNLISKDNAQEYSHDIIFNPLATIKWLAAGQPNYKEFGRMGKIVVNKVVPNNSSIEVVHYDSSGKVDGTDQYVPLKCQAPKKI